MTKFKMVTDDAEEEVIEFQAYIDCDGDFVVYVNGEMLLFVDEASGRLFRNEMYGDFEGITVDENDVIELAL